MDEITPGKNAAISTSPNSTKYKNIGNDERHNTADTAINKKSSSHPSELSFKRFRDDESKDGHHDQKSGRVFRNSHLHHRTSTSKCVGVPSSNNYREGMNMQNNVKGIYRQGNSHGFNSRHVNTHMYTSKSSQMHNPSVAIVGAAIASPENNNTKAIVDKEQSFGENSLSKIRQARHCSNDPLDEVPANKDRKQKSSREKTKKLTKVVEVVHNFSEISIQKSSRVANIPDKLAPKLQDEAENSNICSKNDSSCVNPTTKFTVKKERRDAKMLRSCEYPPSESTILVYSYSSRKDYYDDLCLILYSASKKSTGIRYTNSKKFPSNGLPKLGSWFKIKYSEHPKDNYGIRIKSAIPCEKMYPTQICAGVPCVRDVVKRKSINDTAGNEINLDLCYTCSVGSCIKFSSQQKSMIEQENPNSFEAWIRPYEFQGLRVKQYFVEEFIGGPLEKLNKPTVEAPKKHQSSSSMNHETKQKYQSVPTEKKVVAKSKNSLAQHSTVDKMTDLVEEQIYTDNVVCTSQSDKETHFLVYDTYKRRLGWGIFAKHTQRHWSTWPKPGKWSWLRYSYITSENNAYKTTCNAESEVYISEVLESVHYSRETTRFPTKSAKDGTIQFLLILRKKNKKIKNKSKRPVDCSEERFSEEPDCSEVKTEQADDDSGIHSTLSSDTSSSMHLPSITKPRNATVIVEDNDMVQDEDHESFFSAPQEISEFCDYRSTYGSVKPLRKDLLLAYFDRENYDPDELDEVNQIPTWPEKMKVWCEPNMMCHDKCISSWMPVEIEEILPEDQMGLELELDIELAERSNAPLCQPFISALDSSIQKFHAENILSVDRKKEIKITLDEFTEEFRRIIVRRMPREEAIYLKASSMKLLPFGSFVNGFGTKDSDLDLCAIVPDGCVHNKKVMLVETIGRNFKRFTKDECYQVTVIKDARVPIVKLRHQTTQFITDISIGNTLAQKNSLMLEKYACFDERVAPLGLFIKGWAKQLDINDNSKGTLSSYAFIIMMIHFLQQSKPKPILPFLQEERPTEDPSDYVEDKIDGWDVKFCKNTDALKDTDRFNSTDTVGQLFYNFLYYYSYEFNIVDDVVQIETKEKITKQMRKDNPIKRLCVQDPFDHSHNLTSGVKKEGLTKLLLLMKLTLCQLHDLNSICLEFEGSNKTTALTLESLVSAVKQRMRQPLRRKEGQQNGESSKNLQISKHQSPKASNHKSYKEPTSSKNSNKGRVGTRNNAES